MVIKCNDSPNIVSGESSLRFEHGCLVFSADEVSGRGSSGMEEGDFDQSSTPHIAQATETSLDGMGSQRVRRLHKKLRALPLYPGMTTAIRGSASFASVQPTQGGGILARLLNCVLKRKCCKDRSNLIGLRLENCWNNNRLQKPNCVVICSLDPNSDAIRFGSGDIDMVFVGAGSACSFDDPDVDVVEAGSLLGAAHSPTAIAL